MTIILFLTLFLGAAIAGAFYFFKLAKSRFSKNSLSAKDSQIRLEQANQRCLQVIKEAEKTASQVYQENKDTLSAPLLQMQSDLQEMAQMLKRKEESLKLRESNLALTKEQLVKRETDIKQKEEQQTPIPKARQEAIAKLRTALFDKAGFSKTEIVKMLVDSKLNDAHLDADKLKLTIEEHTKVYAESSAKRIITISNERFNMSHQPEREHPGFRLDNHEIVDFIGTKTQFKDAFMSATQAEVLLFDDRPIIEIRSVDPLKREIARRTLIYMKSQGLLHEDKISLVLRRVEREVERELEQASDRATKLLHIQPLEGEVRRLFSRLLYRASYSQNQWHHAVEVAFICGMMASELGLDVKTARRAGLLHDIGKAMTHDHEGSHALLGADVARKAGESEAVANAIGAHHGEEPMVSAYAEITAAGDAISGARPGARREMQEAFSSKVEDLERIALNFSVVDRVQVMQGGREMRVFMPEKEIFVDQAQRFLQTQEDGFEPVQKQLKKCQQDILNDEQMLPLAQQIANQIEEELTYPGQIRITVVREMRAVGIAR